MDQEHAVYLRKLIFRPEAYKSSTYVMRNRHRSGEEASILAFRCVTPTYFRNLSQNVHNIPHIVTGNRYQLRKLSFLSLQETLSISDIRLPDNTNTTLSQFHIVLKLLAPSLQCVDMHMFLQFL
jgi:hypothetical protein